MTLNLELVHPAANILEVSLRHEHLLSKHHPLASLRRALHRALLDVKDGQHPVLADAEEQGIVKVDPHPVLLDPRGTEAP